VEKPEEKRPLGKPRHRWEDIIKMHNQEVECGSWTGMIWLRLGKTAGSSECGNESSDCIMYVGNFLNSREPDSFSGRTLLHGVIKCSLLCDKDVFCTTKGSTAIKRTGISTLELGCYGLYYQPRRAQFSSTLRWKPEISHCTYRLLCCVKGCAGYVKECGFNPGAVCERNGNAI